MVDKTTIAIAASTGKCIRIRYEKHELDARGRRRIRKRTYTLEPYSYRIIDGKEFLFAWDVKRREETIKQFLTSRILSIRLSSRDSLMRYPVEIST